MTRTPQGKKKAWEGTHGGMMMMYSRENAGKHWTSLEGKPKKDVERLKKKKKEISCYKQTHVSLALKELEPQQQQAMLSVLASSVLNPHLILT